jgi:hypothetical protein
MGTLRRWAWMAALGVSLSLGAQSWADVVIKDVSLDKPLVLDEKTDYQLRNVTVTGLRDGAALVLTGRIDSVTIDHSTFGRVWSGPEGRAAGLECAGCIVGNLMATHSTFFDAENQLATLKEGSFGRVTFERCRFATSETFLKQIYANNPWRSTPPVTEFYNIERLELLENEYSNTMVVIHPSVKQVILRGSMPGLRIENPQATQLFQLSPGQRAESIPPPPKAAVAMIVETKG